MTRALLLDLDGTLADSLGVMRLAYDEFAMAYDCRPSDREFQAVNGPPLVRVVEILAQEWGLPVDEVALQAMLARYEAIIDRAYLSVAVAEGGRILLQAARAQGWKTGVVTSNGTRRVAAWLQLHDLGDLLDVVVAGEYGGPGKPDPAPYRHAVAVLGCRPQDAIAVEDSAQGARSALAAGLQLYVCPPSPHDDITPVSEMTGAITIESLSALAAVLFPQRAILT